MGDKRPMIWADHGIGWHASHTALFVCAGEEHQEDERFL